MKKAKKGYVPVKAKASKLQFSGKQYGLIGRYDRWDDDKKEIEKALGRKAQKEFLDLQPGDVVATYADVDDLIEDVGFKPETPTRTGIQQFIEWYKDYYSIK